MRINAIFKDCSKATVQFGLLEQPIGVLSGCLRHPAVVYRWGILFDTEFIQVNFFFILDDRELLCKNLDISVDVNVGV